MGFQEICKTKKILHILKYILLKRLPVLSFSGGKLQSSTLGIVGAQSGNYFNIMANQKHTNILLMTAPHRYYLPVHPFVNEEV
jgi:hypothetical protein